MKKYAQCGFVWYMSLFFSGFFPIMIHAMSVEKYKKVLASDSMTEIVKTTKALWPQGDSIGFHIEQINGLFSVQGPVSKEPQNEYRQALEQFINDKTKLWFKPVDRSQATLYRVNADRYIAEARNLSEIIGQKKSDRNSIVDFIKNNICNAYHINPLTGVLREEPSHRSLSIAAMAAVAGLVCCTVAIGYMVYNGGAASPNDKQEMQQAEDTNEISST